MGSAEPLRLSHKFSQLIDRNRGCVGSDNTIFRYNLTDHLIEIFFYLNILRNRLDHQLGIPKTFGVHRVYKGLLNLSGFFFGQHPIFNQSSVAVRHNLPCPFKIGFTVAVKCRMYIILRKRLGDNGSHQARSRNNDVSNVWFYHNLFLHSYLLWKLSLSNS